MNILLADDHTLFSDSLHMALNTIFLNCKVTTTGTWEDVIKHTTESFFDLLLLDLIMPDSGEGLWKLYLTKVIACQQGPICIISGLSDQSQIRQVYDLGASGYIHKTFTLKQMQQSLNIVYSGEKHFPSMLTLPVKNNDATKIITPRQHEILKLLSTGNSNKNIADMLFLSENTIKRHVYNLYRALDAKNRADAIRIGQQRNLLSL